MSTQVAENLDLAAPYAITREHLDFFRVNGFIKLKQVLSPEVLAHYGDEITRKVRELNTQHLPMELRNTYQKAFLQIMNLWTKSEVVKEFVFSPRLARIATDLLEVSGVRVYHDQALYKEPSGGYTPWHADQFYWPLSTDRTITAWIPLQATPKEMGPLSFAAKSQRMEFGRELVISDESEEQLAQALQLHQYEVVETAYDLGEVSFHLGWNYHRAGPNVTKHPRKVMTIIYMEENIRVIEPRRQEHVNDLASWMPGCKPGEVAASVLNPVLFSYRQPGERGR